MATPAWTETPIGDGLQNVVKLTATLTTADHTSEAVGPHLIQHTDLCLMTAAATWGGATLKIEGSNDGTNWIALRDPSHTAIALTSDDIRQVLERPLYWRCRLTTVGVGASVPIVIVARRNQRTKR